MQTVVIAGLAGSMGQQTIQMVTADSELELVGGYSARPHPELNLSIPIATTLKEVPQADLWIDFSTPTAVFENTKFALEHGYHPIIGTTGLTDTQVAELQQIAKTNHLGGLIAPNFGLSAVLLMQFAQQAAKYFPDVEIIEMHHQNKKDAPSGTALNTAKLINQVRTKTDHTDSKETLPGARGGDLDGIHIHSVRLPGYVAHEEVLFGGAGEALTIRQDSFDRKSFMTGVQLACHRVARLDQLVVGLENILN